MRDKNKLPLVLLKLGEEVLASQFNLAAAAEKVVNLHAPKIHFEFEQLKKIKCKAINVF